MRGPPRFRHHWFTKKETTLTLVFFWIWRNLVKGFDTYIEISRQVVLTNSLKSCSFADHGHGFAEFPHTRFQISQNLRSRNCVIGHNHINQGSGQRGNSEQWSRMFKNDRFVLLPASADACPRVVVQSVHQAGTPEERHTVVPNS